MPKIPKILHYCFWIEEGFKGKPWSLVHYVSVASAVKKLQPDAVYFYYCGEPAGVWWELTRPLVTLVKMTPPSHIFGNPLLHPAHKADVVRLEKLIEHGGIYLDIDAFVLRNFDDLLDYSTVMGMEGEGGEFGLGNAVILAERQAPFLVRWYDRYHSFRGAPGVYWSEHSIELPGRLAKEHPEDIHVLPPKAFFPFLWNEQGLSELYESSKDIPLDASYVIHLWETFAWKYLDHLTPGKVRARKTTFHELAAPYVEGLADKLGDRTLTQKGVKLAKGIARKILK